MATKLMVYEVEYEGEIYELEAPDGASEDDLYAAVSSYKPAAAPQAPQVPAPTQNAPQVAPSAPQGPSVVPTSQQVLAPNAMLGANAEQTVATVAEEEVPEARDFLRDQFFNRKSFGEAQREFNTRFGRDATLPDSAAGAWAERQALMDTPAGRQWLQNNDPIDPVNRITGLEDVNTPDSALEEFGVSAKRSLSNMANTVTGFAGVAADIVGADETAQALADEYLEKQAAIGMNYPTSAGQAVEIRSFDDFGRWAASTLGELAPQLTASLGAGAVGGLVGRKLVERKAADFVEQQVANGVAREVAEAEVAKQVQRATVRGGIAGAAAVSEVQEVGSIYGDTYAKTSELSPWTSLLAGTAAASLDTILPARILSKVGGPVANDMIADGLVKRIGKEAAAGFLLEGGTEAIQTIIEQLPAGQPIEWDQVLEAALRGGFGGSVASGAAGAYEGVRQQKALPATVVPEPTGVPQGSSPIAVPDATNRRTKAYRTQIADTAEQVSGRINELVSEWENAPTFEVHQNFNGLKGVARNAVGALGSDGKVIINTENLIKQAAATGRTVDQMVSALTYHEALGHHGLTQLFGDTLDTKLAEMLENSPVYKARVDKWLKKNKDAYAGDRNRDLRAFEELLAEGSEKGQLPASFVNQMKNWIKDFGRTRLGLEMEYSTREVETILGMAHSAVVNGKSRDVRANGFRYMYLGQGAETADLNKLESAKYLLRKGMSKERTRKETGWFQAEDGGWRFEIPDNEATFKKFNEELLDMVVLDTDYEQTSYDMLPFDTTGDAIDSLNNPVLREKMNLEGLYLPEVFDHPELYAAYPELAEITVYRESAEHAEPELKEKAAGAFDAEAQAIYVNSGLSKREIKKTILHEIQHYVQEKEGFSQGGSSDTAIEMLTDENVKTTAENYLRWAKGAPKKNRDTIKIVDHLLEKKDYKVLKEFLKTRKAVGDEAYNFLHGEMEARDVEARMDYGQAERIGTKPYSSEKLHPDYMLHDKAGGSPSLATVYHGSPHDFDEFDHSKMGTGEGAQVYGWGTYLTDTESVARGYRDTLSGREQQTVLTGVDGRVHTLPKYYDYRLLGEIFGFNPDDHALRYPVEFAMDQLAGGSTLEEAVAETIKNYDYFDEMTDTKHWRQGIDAFAQSGAHTKNNGKLYHVDIPDDATWLLYDKPMKDQPEKVQSFFKKLGFKQLSLEAYDRLSRNYIDSRTEFEYARQARESFTKSKEKAYIAGNPNQDVIEWAAKETEILEKRYEKTRAEYMKYKEPFEKAIAPSHKGKGLYEKLVDIAGSPKDASEMLFMNGITGNKYLDGFSRNRGDGTYNYVMFSDKTPKIVNKYMMMTSPDKVTMTPEEIAAMDPEDIVESQNAYDLLKSMVDGYTPTVMTLDDLEAELRLRDLSVSTILKQKTFEPGEITKRLFMFDVAMSKLDEQITKLYSKMQDGTATATDRSNFLKADFKRQELTGRIWDEQSEIARALAAMKQVKYTRRRIEGAYQTVAQIAEGSPYEFLNDPEQFFKYATSVQQQMEAAREKVKDKGMEFVGNALNLPRALMSTMDLSAPLRQGFFLIHKPAWWRSFANMFRYWGSEKAFQDLMEDIVNRPTYNQMQTANLALSDIDGKLTRREEDFQTEWAQKIPGLGRAVRMSERAYSGFLNKLRADVFDQMVANVDSPTSQDLKDIGKFINSASGRGNLPDGSGVLPDIRSAGPMLNGLFFSPRLMASRVDMLTRLGRPSTYTKMNKVARNEYIKSLMATGSLALLVTSLAAMAGAEVEKDPRSSDFAKIKVGDTRYDILGGSGQYITLAARLVKNSYKTTDGDIKPYGNEFGQTNRLDAGKKFLENKLAPVPSFVADYLRGVNAIGEKFELDKALVQRFVPMFVMDVYENMQEEGVAKGAAMGVPALFGVGVQNYKSASSDPSRELEAPVTFDMKSAKDGEYNNATVEDGIVKLDEEAQKEWATRLNTYTREWMKEEMAKPEWKTMNSEERKEVIADVRKDARKETKLDMLELLQIEETE